MPQRDLFLARETASLNVISLTYQSHLALGVKAVQLWSSPAWEAESLAAEAAVAEGPLEKAGVSSYCSGLPGQPCPCRPGQPCRCAERVPL